MKTETRYSCEHCGYTSTDEAAVARCEAIPMRPATVELGDIVSTIGGGYGWWRGDESWFHYYSEEEQAEAIERAGHHAGIGQPMFVVVDIVPYSTLGNTQGGDYAHHMTPVLYSPSHANRGDTRVAYGWTGGEHFTIRGKVSPADLKRYQKLAAKLGRPEYFSH